MKNALFLLVIISLALSACNPKTSPTPLAQEKPAVNPAVTPAAGAPTKASGAVSATQTPAATASVDVILYQNSALPVEMRVEDLLKRMSLEEKIGQITQVEKDSLSADDVNRYLIGSVLSGGGGSPRGTKTPEAWQAMVGSFQAAAMKTRLGIPIIYGVDAVHGHGNLYGATIFPQNIGLGMANDPDLMKRIGRATAEELAATGIRWDFAPVLAVTQDIRWGRTYESYSENTDIVSSLGSAYIEGLQNAGKPGGLSDPLAALATAKHYIGDGGTRFGTSKTTNMGVQYLLDQGDMQVDEATIRNVFLPPYQQAIQSGALSVMVSYSSWNGVKMHAQKYLITDVLKGELGFSGFVVSDWQAIDQIDPDYYKSVVASINAGLDMIMVPSDYRKFINTLNKAVQDQAVSMERIDDAVRRILRVKFQMGLFEQPMPGVNAADLVANREHLALAEEAVHKSLVLLVNRPYDGGQPALPISSKASTIFVAGQGADDIGMQSGGWTIIWQGQAGKITTGTTILEGIKAQADPGARVEYNRFGRFEKLVDDQKNPIIADVGVVVVGEQPYAEGVGDRKDLALTTDELVMIDRVRAQSRDLILVVLSGRPLVITEALNKVDAVVAAWLPGSQGAAVADNLFGKAPFTGRLSFTWPRWNSQLPFDFSILPGKDCHAPLFPFGYGLDTGDPSPAIPDCPYE